MYKRFFCFSRLLRLITLTYDFLSMYKICFLDTLVQFSRYLRLNGLQYWTSWNLQTYFSIVRANVFKSGFMCYMMFAEQTYMLTSRYKIRPIHRKEYYTKVHLTYLQAVWKLLKFASIWPGRKLNYLALHRTWCQSALKL